MPRPSWHRKVQSPRQVAAAVRRLQRRGRRVVFTNGCFDLLHVGHATILEKAKRLGDVLVVGINSDRSVRRLSKGPERPIVPQRDRALMLAALSSVDYVTVFNDATPYRLISLLKPDILVKGADWAVHDVVGRDLVKRVVRLPLVRGRSTTDLVQRIRRGG